ncbi:hypothetical protein BX659_11679 [Orenia metallireducens]|uniref:Uncharacterized protein n=2 Tax=Orenia metallireducens TaxID=1413210 RepID=A0A285HGK5_9FIRM|nr:hypothetical protein [Orenia metallireducens]PRX27489.1 hypothetical protein BX659_11679 [Orenia metallireducens]SNY34764.1 hypothetical protein SAMN06265827_11876 [Orenia metallireducens]
METEYDIDVEAISKLLGMSNSIRKRNRGWLKQIAAYYYFKVQGNWHKLKDKIFEQNEIYDFE